MIVDRPTITIKKRKDEIIPYSYAWRGGDFELCNCVVVAWLEGWSEGCDEGCDDGATKTLTRLVKYKGLEFEVNVLNSSGGFFQSVQRVPWGFCNNERSLGLFSVNLLMMSCWMTNPLCLLPFTVYSMVMLIPTLVSNPNPSTESISIFDGYSCRSDEEIMLARAAL